MVLCRHCKNEFEITEAERMLREKLSPVIAGNKFDLPAPSLCPECRLQRRMIWRPEIHMRMGKSAYSGKSILSIYRENTPMTVYDAEEWFLDVWNPHDYAQAFNFDRPFLEQFQELLVKVPTPARSVNYNENCDFVNSASQNRNCYLIAAATANEDCYYGNYLNFSKSCVDDAFLIRCELCYECLDCSGCYNVKFATNSHNCSESWFLQNCRNCQNCFGSVNLVGKQYVFFNEQLTKEDYEKRLADLHLGKRSSLESIKTRFESHRLQYPYRFMVGELNENVTGNCVHSSKNSSNCFDVTEAEDCMHCYWYHKCKDCMDCYSWGITAEACYECLEVGNNSRNIYFCTSVYNSNDLYYSNSCRSSQNLFGCVGLVHKSYCIFNKQFTKEEYEILVPKIISHMQKTGEWGEFFPMSLSPFAYNETIANDYYPLSKERALELGAELEDQPTYTVRPSTVPDDLQDVTDEILQQTFYCEETGKPYRIIPQELAFYRRMGLPLPSKAFYTRHGNRLKRRLPRKLWDRNCAKCQVHLRTSYSPDRPETVYCNSCYLQAIY